MILTKSADCTSVLINSSNFNTNNRSNTLSVSVKGGTPKVLTLGASITNYVFNAASLGLTELVDGPYEFILSSVLLDFSKSSDLGCTVLLCSYECASDVLELYKNADNLEKVLAFEGLKNVTECETCGCDLANNLFNIFTNEPTTNANSCGCH